MTPHLDKNGRVVEIGMMVDAPEPNESDNYINAFTGTICGFHGKYVTVEDQDGECSDVECERLEIV